MITIIINTLKGFHAITGDKYDKVFLLEIVKSLRNRGLSTEEVISALKDIYF